MRQIMPFQGKSTIGTGNTWHRLMTGCDFGGTSELGMQIAWPVAGDIRYLRLGIAAPAGAGAGWVFTVRINGSDTSAVIVISGSSVVGTWAGTVAVSVGDLISLSCVPFGVPNQTSIITTTIEFDSTADDESGYAMTALVSGAVDGFVGAFGAGFAASDSGGTVGDVVTIAPMAGEIDAIYVTLAALSGAATATTTVYKNGTAQDGTGGTVDSVASAVASEAGVASGNLSLSLPFVAADELAVAVECTGLSYVTFACRVVANTAGQSIVAMRAVAADDERYAAIRSGEAGASWEESPGEDSTSYAGVTPFSLSDMYVGVLDAPGSGHERTFTLNVASADTGLSATIDDTNTEASDTSSTVSVSAGAVLTMHHTISGTPMAAAMFLSMVQTTAKSLPGSFVRGVSTRVTAARAAAFGLDGNQNTHSEEGVLKVFGAVDATDDISAVGDGNLVAEAAALGTGAVAGKQVSAQRNTSGDGAAGTLVLQDKSGTDYYVWIEDGVVRFHTSAPTEDDSTVAHTDGSGLATDAHASTHSDGGDDEIDITDLGGYPGGTTNFLRADGTFAAPPAGGSTTLAARWTIDGAGSAISTGAKSGAVWTAPTDGMFTRAVLNADQSGDIVIDIWKDTFANYPPTDADSITASAPPTLSASAASEDDTLSGWTTSFSAGDQFVINVDSVSTVTRVTLTLEWTPS